MNYSETVNAIKSFLQEQYTPFINNNSIDRLLLTDRKELLRNMKNITPVLLNEVLKQMDKEGYIQEDNGILITFKLSFLLG
jgi:hypothetical protein